MHFVASYPKSGSAWVRLVHATYSAGDTRSRDLTQAQEGDNHVARIPQYSDADPYHYQSVCPFPIEQADFPTEARLRPAAMLVLEREISLSGTSIPPLVNSHHLYEQVDTLPLWNDQWTDKVVNPVRDPREVCCLYADYRNESYEETAAFMAESYARTGDDETDRVRHFISTWSNHVQRWLDTEDFPVYTVRHRDLQTHPVEVFYDIFDFLEVPDLDESRIQEAVENARLGTLQTAGAGPDSPEAHGQQDRFSQPGQTDGWKDELPPDVARTIEEDHGRVMEALGYL